MELLMNTLRQTFLNKFYKALLAFSTIQDLVIWAQIYIESKKAQYKLSLKSVLK